MPQKCYEVCFKTDPTCNEKTEVTLIQLIWR